MITCPKCNTGPAKNIHKSVLQPAEDRFECRECGNKFYRYAPRVSHVPGKANQFKVDLNQFPDPLRIVK